MISLANYCRVFPKYNKRSGELNKISLSLANKIYIHINLLVQGLERLIYLFNREYWKGLIKLPHYLLAIYNLYKSGISSGLINFIFWFSTA